MQEYTNKILDAINLFWDDLAYNKINKVSYGDLIYALLTYGSMKESAKYLGITERTLERIPPLALSHLCGTDSSNGTPWKFLLLALIDVRPCYRCKQYKSWSRDFYFKDTHKCKECDTSYKREDRLKDPDKYSNRSKAHYTANKHDYIIRSSNRKELLLKATAKWANLTKIKEIYSKCPDGYHVDHILPLQGKLICGLHVENNLQYLIAKDNLSKGNHYEEPPSI